MKLIFMLFIVLLEGCAAYIPANYYVDYPVYNYPVYPYYRYNYPTYPYYSHYNRYYYNYRW